MLEAAVVVGLLQTHLLVLAVMVAEGMEVIRWLLELMAQLIEVAVVEAVVFLMAQVELLVATAVLEL
jgi:hypothetical protein